MTSTFIYSIKARLRVLGMDLQDSLKDGELYSLRLRDRVNNIEYTGFATEHEEEDVAQFWLDVLDNKMPNALVNHSDKTAEAASIPAIVVLPSQDVDILYSEANKRGAYPARYQLFDKYTVLAFSAVDSAALRAYVQGQPREIPDNAAIIVPKTGKRRYIVAALLLLVIAGVAAKATGIFEPKLAGVGSPYWAASSPNSDERAIAAADSSIPVLYLRALAQDKNERVRIAVAGNSALPEDVLEALSRDSSSAVRDRVASHPLATAAIRSRVYPDISLAPCDVREKVYAGGSVTPDMLATASRSSDTCAKRGVAQNETASLDVLTTLTRDDDVWVRAHATQSIRQVVGFPNVFDTALRNFVYDVEQLVRDTIFQRELRQADSSWQLLLRQAINGAFRKNVYDPLGMRNVPDNPMSFEIFLADSASSSAYAALVARTADDIVSNAMNAVTPYLEGILDDDPRNQTNATLFGDEFIIDGVKQLEELELSAY